MQKTTGIVLQKIRYNDSRQLARIFIQDLGIITAVYTVSKKKGNQARIYQPGNILSLELSAKTKGEMVNIREASFHEVFSSIPDDVSKSLILTFVCEMVQIMFKDMEVDNRVYCGLVEFIFSLESETNQSVVNQMHISFLFQLLRWSGFYPESEKDFVPNLDTETQEVIKTLLNEEGYLIKTKDLRRKATRAVLSYIETHVPEVSRIKSLKVLEEISD